MSRRLTSPLHWQTREIHHVFSHSETGERLEFTSTAQCKADSFHTCLALITEGAGIGLMPDFLFEQMKHSLALVLPEYQLPVNPVYALHPYNNSLPLSMAVCLESIENQLHKTI